MRFDPAMTRMIDALDAQGNDHRIIAAATIWDLPEAADGL